MNITYEKIQIRNAEKKDALQFVTWWNDGEVMAHAGFPNGTNTSIQEVESLLSKNNEQRRNLIIEYDHTCIGEMVYIKRSAEIVEIGIKICVKEYQNRGLGKMILCLFINSLFQKYHFKKIVLDTNQNNMRAQHVYESLGFKKTGMRVNA